MPDTTHTQHQNQCPYGWNAKDAIHHDLLTEKRISVDSGSAFRYPALLLTSAVPRPRPCHQRQWLCDSRPTPDQNNDSKRGMQNQHTWARTLRKQMALNAFAVNWVLVSLEPCLGPSPVSAGQTAKPEGAKDPLSRDPGSLTELVMRVYFQVHHEGGLGRKIASKNDTTDQLVHKASTIHHAKLSCSRLSVVECKELWPESGYSCCSCWMCAQPFACYCPPFSSFWVVLATLKHFFPSPIRPPPSFPASPMAIFERPLTNA